MHLGEVTEWPIVRHWKCRVGVKPHRGFESPPLRFSQTIIFSDLSEARTFWPARSASKGFSCWRCGLAKALSRRRVGVEHGIGRLRRFEALTQADWHFRKGHKSIPASGSDLTSPLGYVIQATSREI